MRRRGGVGKVCPASCVALYIRNCVALYSCAALCSSGGMLVPVRALVMVVMVVVTVRVAAVAVVELLHLLLLLLLLVVLPLLLLLHLHLPLMLPNLPFLLLLLLLLRLHELLLQAQRTDSRAVHRRRRIATAAATTAVAPGIPTVAPNTGTERGQVPCRTCRRDWQQRAG